MSSIKTAAAMFAAVILALFLAMTIYNYQTPKVFAAYAGKGMINDELYDCVMPSEAVSEEGIVYMAKAINTVLGVRYRVYEQNVIVLAEDNGLCAVNLYGECLVIIAHDGRMKGNGSVLVYRS